MVNLQLLKIGPGEISIIRELADKIWRSHYPEVIGIKQVEFMLEKFYNNDSMKVQMLEGQQFFLIHSDSKPIGFIAITDKNEGEWFLNKFYIDTDLHRQGLGRKAFELVLALLGDSVKTMRLQVNRQNYKPINFYFKMGFVIERVADFDIGDGYFMNDFVMVWHAK
ncbi:MAG: GNAT family N-acetyltransferase [Bacteroidota bacterium]|jgi:ribosomal protein S18 acetylase RimI-like enzyme